MSTEMLERIFELAAGAGDGAFALAVIYMGAQYAWVILWSGVFYGIFKTIRYLISMCTFARAVADVVGYNIRGEVDDYDRSAILERIVALVTKRESK